MGIAYEDDRALELNEMIFETIYHAAMTTSMELAKVEGPYSSLHGSPLSKGIF